CETFGFVLAEALRSATPVVVPNRGAAPHMVSEECAGIYEATAGGAEIARAARAVLARDRAEVERAALDAAARHPSVEQHFDALFALYSTMLREGGRRAAA